MGNPLPGQQTNPSLLYRLPWSVVFNLALVASVLGSGRGFVEAWTAENSPRMITGGSRVADDAFYQRRLAEALWALDAGVALLHTDIDAMSTMAEGGVTANMEDRAHWRWNMNRSCDLVGHAVAELFRSASGRSIFLDHPLQRRFQDVQAALSHAFLVPDPLARAVGGARLGTTHPELVL
jgi:3-hydroxy-9,10-secoandrosta-1,3,5(10)-triene-9,17-dione monooxygenase